MKVVEFSYHFVIQSAFVVKKLKLHLKKFCKLERDGKKENGKKKKASLAWTLSIAMENVLQTMEEKEQLKVYNNFVVVESNEHLK